jgi:hypothetical protein
MYCHLLLHRQSSPPSALLLCQSCNHIPYIPMFSCCHHHVAMLLPCSTDAATTATVLPPPPQCCHTTATTLPPKLGCCHHHAAVSAAVLPPSCRHRYCHQATATAATTASIAKLPLLPPSCRRGRYLHCEISLIMKTNSVT